MVVRGIVERPTCATFEIKSINSDIDPTQVVRSDGSNADPAASLPLRDDEEEFRELTLAQRGMASAPVKIAVTNNAVIGSCYKHITKYYVEYFH